MKNHTAIFCVVLFFLVIMIIAIRQRNVSITNNAVPKKSVIESAPQNNQNKEKQAPEKNNQEMNFQAPLEKARERVTKKSFGLFVSPKSSPVQPERFTGYHTGVDFEIFPSEEMVDVQVRAVCSGKLLIKRYANGYGGLVVQSCTLKEAPITVIYGHLQLANIVDKIGQDINMGDLIGILGKGYSSETDGERKHLHLGFHKGSNINILGYVQNKAQLNDWIDPCLFVCGN